MRKSKDKIFTSIEDAKKYTKKHPEKCLYAWQVASEIVVTEDFVKFLYMAHGREIEL